MSRRGLCGPRRWLLLAALVCWPTALWAAAGESGFPDLLLVVAAMLAVGKLFSEGAVRLGLPGVLGELLAGVVLGPGLLGMIPTGAASGADFIRLLAELGVILLLFEVGLETNLAAMFKVGGAAAAVAAVGVLLPFSLGYVYWSWVPHPVMGDGGDLGTVAIFVGATLTATSVGITARVLGDLGQMNTPEARVILGAAVLDDVIGLVILGVVSGLAAGGVTSVASVAGTFAVAAGFLVAVVIVGNLVVPRLADRVARMRASGVVVVLSLAFALALAAFAAKAGSALIIGAFAAGLVLSRTSHVQTIETQVRPVAAVLAPIFFVNIGAALDLSILRPGQPGAAGPLLVAAALTVLAVLGKVAAGWAAPWLRLRRLAVGVGMVPRGEVGLIFADVGRQAGLLSGGTFSAVLLMVMATTFLAPLWLKLIFGGREVSG
jgi:Kef-type K+ transport system membrane component KefB